MERKLWKGNIYCGLLDPGLPCLQSLEHHTNSYEKFRRKPVNEYAVIMKTCRHMLLLWKKKENVPICPDFWCSMFRSCWLFPPSVSVSHILFSKSETWQFLTNTSLSYMLYKSYIMLKYFISMNLQYDIDGRETSDQYLFLITSFFF
jgi:hypothetical protein